MAGLAQSASPCNFAFYMVYFFYPDDKEAGKMPTENERKDIQKAMAYDLLRVFKQEPDKTFSYEELEKLIDAYISGLKQ